MRPELPRVQPVQASACAYRIDCAAMEWPISPLRRIFELTKSVFTIGASVAARRRLSEQVGREGAEKCSAQKTAAAQSEDWAAATDLLRRRYTTLAVIADGPIRIPEAGLEPARPCGHWILSPARLPIPPLRHE